MTEPTDDTLEAMMLAMLEAANNVEGYVAVQQYGIGTGGEAEMRAVFRVVQAALAAQPQAEVQPSVGVQACRPEDRAMLATPVGAELVAKVAQALAVPTAVATAPAQPSGWIACAERMPPLGEDVLVWLLEPACEGGSHVLFDCWDEQHEAPVSFSSATLPVGPGWDSGAYFEQISHWMPLPPPPDAPR